MLSPKPTSLPDACRQLALTLLAAALLCLPPTSQSAEFRKVHLLQTTDIHGTFTEDDGAANGAWLRLATVIQAQRQRLGPDASLLIDCGDTCQGSITATVSRGEASIAALRHLAYDVWVPGNHELDFGHRQFAHLTEQAADLILCGNLRLVDGPPLPAWKMFTRNGVDIAVIGATASYMKNWLLPTEAKQYHVETAAAQLTRILPEIHRAKPDVIVLAAHQAWFEGRDPRNINEIASLAERFPDLDLILGAHSHRLIPGMRIGHRTWYVQTGCYAQYLGIVTLTVNTEANEVVDIASHTRQITHVDAEDAGLAQALRPWLEKARAERARVIAPALAAPISAVGRPGSTCATSELLCAAIAAAAQAPIVMHGRLTQKSLGRQVTGADLFALVPYENTIILADVTRAELEDIISEQWKYRDSYRFSGLYGARAQLNANGKATVLGIGKDEPPPADDKRLTLAMNSHTAAGTGTFPMLLAILQKQETRMRDTGISTRQAVEDFLRQHPDQAITPFPWMTTEP
ncbi:MAG TPA: bifunctional UDP-sugar hydrolase/5'-nucleotidase [Lentisphaeria bacterium]|nr:MAG: Endonuclease YhcR precursor [Lentisphaerae bacterium ADurb.Bin082]HQC52266.1 bifunctional UDP-sugar hydrolase/5'-nucleotidase [Lentisphaeria bacterium]HQL86554.1 bifunctional UDP-sugar hydrolase/5'-nucleotidase [Lentisphaeria bacterium]